MERARQRSGTGCRRAQHSQASKRDHRRDSDLHGSTVGATADATSRWLPSSREDRDADQALARGRRTSRCSGFNEFREAATIASMSTSPAVTTIVQALQRPAAPVADVLQSPELLPAASGFYGWWSHKGALPGVPYVPHPHGSALW
jgi:hypothetical protein